MRTRKSARNAVFAASAYLVSILANAIVRLVFVRVLSAEYLGLTDLFASILGYLSLAELGMGNALVFALYRPLALGDSARVGQLLAFYRKVYAAIAVAVAGLGLLVMPTIPYLASDFSSISQNVYVLYGLYLLSSLVTYLVAHKRSFLIAAQDQYLVSCIDGIYNLLTGVIQPVVLLITQDFLAYLLAQVILSLLRNIAIASVCDRRHPVQRETTCPLPSSDKAAIFRNVRALFLYRISGIVVNSTDNVIVSSIFGLAQVGAYSNYQMLFHAVQTLIAQGLTAMTASVGHLHVEASVARKRSIYRTVVFAGAWAYGIASLVLYMTVEPVISLWVGRQYLMQSDLLLILAANFFLLGIAGCFNIFRNAFGLFVQGQIRPVVGSIANVGLSILLAKLIGIRGVFLGTTIALAATNLWFDPYIVHKYVFQESVVRFYITFLQYMLAIVVGFLLTDLVYHWTNPSNAWLDLAVRGVLSLMVGSGVFLAAFGRSPEAKSLVAVARRLARSLRNNEAIAEPSGPAYREIAHDVNLASNSRPNGEAETQQ